MWMVFPLYTSWDYHLWLFTRYYSLIISSAILFNKQYRLHYTPIIIIPFQRYSLLLRV